jgi:hypothetical protein
MPEDPYLHYTQPARHHTAAGWQGQLSAFQLIEASRETSLTRAWRIALPHLDI